MLNTQIFFFFYNFAHKSLFLDKVIYFFADTFPYIVILLAILFLLLHHDVLKTKNLSKPVALLKAFAQKWKEITIVFFSGILAWILAEILKLFIHTERPFLKLPNIVSLFNKTGYAFPSGHATFFMALAFALFFVHKKIGYVFMIFAIIISVARIAAGVHFPIDILGGFALGILTAYLIKSFKIIKT